MNYMNEFHARANKFKCSQLDIEKCVAPIYEKLHVNGDSTIWELLNNLEKERTNETVHLEEYMYNITTELKAKIGVMKNSSEIEDYKRFKMDMVNLQENIRKLQYDIKFNMKLKETENEELIEDIQYYKNKLLEWSQPIKLDSTTLLPLGNKQHLKKHSCKEVSQFLHFIHISGGHENGWKKEDHQLFLKLYSKKQKVEELAEQLHEILPDIGKEDIISHVEWYEKYSALKRKQREAIHNWQRNRFSQKSTAEIITKTKIISKPIVEENNQEKLSKWKAEKRSKLLDLINQEKIKEERQHQLEETKKQQHNEIKKMVQEWKSNKAEIEQQTKIQKQLSEEYEKRRRAALANKMIKSFQTQDDIYIMKMKQLQKTSEKIPLRSKSSSLANRDPNRLLKPTKQWMHRVHDDHLVPKKFSGACSLTCIPKLGIPDWRK